MNNLKTLKICFLLLFFRGHNKRNSAYKKTVSALLRARKNPLSCKSAKLKMSNTLQEFHKARKLERISKMRIEILHQTSLIKFCPIFRKETNRDLLL